MIITDLPEDILSIIFILLDPKSFLALCRSCKALYDNYQKDSLYWRTEVSTTFRTPISPLLMTDGARWYSLCHRLRTQTRLYTWGQGIKGNLGHGIGLRRGQAPRLRRGGRIVAPPRLIFARTSSSWPTEAHVPDDVGAIADLQCGGWSTIILSSAGRLYATGSINSANFVNVGSQTDQFVRLEYLTQSTSAISQFSAGRTHVLALTDDHEILSWDRINAKGLKIFSRHGGKFAGKPTRVVAGWAEGSAYVPDVGIIYWKPLQNDQVDDMLDGRQVKERIIPHTARTLARDGTMTEIGAYIVLEGIIVWITSTSQIWACDVGHFNEEDTEPRIASVMLPGYMEETDQLKDIQGNFRNFAVFTARGKVLAGDTDYIRRCFDASQSLARESIAGSVDVSDSANWPNLDEVLRSRPRDVPALQNAGVVSVKFGDWHYQALYANGKVTSHGHEPESCGALGLGDAFHGGKLRGLITGAQGLREDTKIRPVANLKGRQVWFEPEKKEWLEHLQKLAEECLSNNREQTYWDEILHDKVKQTVFSEWIEQEGRHWEDGPSSPTSKLPKRVGQTRLNEDNTNHLDPHFVLAIGAAGWHSGSLVLVDEEQAEQTRRRWFPCGQQTLQEGATGQASNDDQLHNGSEAAPPIWAYESFPMIKFPDGSESPHNQRLAQGEHTVNDAPRPWRSGMPTMQELGLD